MTSPRVVLLTLLLAAVCKADPGSYFAIEVVDEQTGRGVPMVELQTTASTRHYTDSAGVVAFSEPGLMGQRVFFGVTAHGYEFPKDGFGVRGVVLETKPGAVARIKVKRINVAERLYRVTGAGIYRDTVLLGRKPPVDVPLVNAEVTGQDGVLNAVYGGRLWWFYGDTLRVRYALGNFSMSGATTELPEKIDPEKGFRLNYIVGKDGFSRAMAPMEGEGVVWQFAMVVLPDENGRERMMSYYQRRRGLEATLENGFVEYDDASETFKKVKVVPEIDPPVYPSGYPFRAKDGAQEYIYFTTPYPSTRVRAERSAYLDLAQYECYTPLKAGTKYEGAAKTELEAWGWKRGTPVVTQPQLKELVAAGRVKGEEIPQNLRDVETGKPFLLNNCSVEWNAYRKRFVMIASEHLGATALGEVWYAEADRPEGPWGAARKVITHANKEGDAHDFYNPVHHAFLDREGGRVIYLEGSYVNTFSGNKHPTPWYEYNQIMYRLDLSDPRLKGVQR